MNLRPVILIAIALLIAGLATLTAHQWMGNRLAPAETVETSRVVAAASDLAAGTRIDLTMIKMIPVPAESIPEKAFRDPQAVVGQYAVSNLLKGEPILEGRVAPQLGPGTMAKRLSGGRRAITIGAGELAGLTGFLTPGNRIDLLSAGLQAVGGSADSRTLLQNLLVLAVDPPMTPDKFDPTALRSVTFEVDPRQAEQIVRATEKGKLRMTLRNPDDNTVREPDSQGPIISEPAAVEEKTPETRYAEIRVIRGIGSTPAGESETRVLVPNP
jgi:pilus assembly protein CpaB